MEQPLSNVIGGNTSLHRLIISPRVSNWTSFTTRMLRSAALSSRHAPSAHPFELFRLTKQKSGARPVFMIQRICRSSKWHKGGNVFPLERVRSNASKSEWVLQWEDINGCCGDFSKIWRKNGFDQFTGCAEISAEKFKTLRF